MSSCPDRLIALYGTQSEAGRHLGVRRMVIWTWRRQGYIPSRWATVIEAKTRGAITTTEILAEALEKSPPVAARPRKSSKTEQKIA